MFVCDSITAILLFAQFSILRSRAILVIASAYLFTALILIPYVLAFPGVFAPTGLIGGLQSAAWLYVLWHCGFPLFVIGYAISKDEGSSKRFSKGTPRAAIAPECRADGGPRFGSGICLHSGRSAIAPHHARSVPFDLAVALSCWGAHRAGKYFSPSSCSGFGGARCSIFG